MTELDGLPRIALDATATNAGSGASRTTTVTLTNPSTSLAFMVELRLDKGAGGGEVLPSTWSDNFFSLLPGEQRQVVASYTGDATGGAAPSVALTGWNVEPATVKPP